MPVHSVFVYGTLKSGERNHQILSRRKALYLGRTKTIEPYFVMVQFNSRSTPGQFSPGVFRGPLDVLEPGRIVGEIFQVDDDTLAELDRLEGVGVNYNRVPIALEGGRAAHMYLKRRDGRPYDVHSPYIHYKDRCYEWSQGLRL